jgi:hypothetical protein
VGPTIFDTHIFIEHAFVGQLCTHRGDPIYGSVEDDQAVDLLGRLDIAKLSYPRGLMFLQERGEFLHIFSEKQGRPVEGRDCGIVGLTLAPSPFPSIRGKRPKARWNVMRAKEE